MITRATIWRVFLASVVLFSAVPGVSLAYLSPIACEGPLNGPTTTTVAGAYEAVSGNIAYGSTLPAPQNNQFFCGTLSNTLTINPACTPGPGCVQYNCEETADSLLLCKNYLFPASDFYTCSWLNGFPPEALKSALSSNYNGWLFDNCVRSVSFLDTTPPSNPTNLSATAVSSSQINLTWTASTDNVGVAMYSVERCTGVSCADFIQITAVLTASYNDTGLTPSTSYSYRVRAYDAAYNFSGYSNTASATTPAAVGTTPPSPPFLSGTVVSSSQINLSWTESTDDVGVAGYEIFRNNAAVAVVGPTTLLYNNLGLAPSTIYSFRVEAFDDAGNRTASNTISLTTPAGPDIIAPVFTPTSPSAELPSGTTAATLGGTTNESAVCRYSLSVGQSFALMTPFADTSGANHAQPLTGLADNTAYSYAVKCRDSANNTSGDLIVMFSVLAPAPVLDTIPPIISNGQPVGQFASGTQTATLAVTTNEVAYCGFSQTPNTEFSAMTSFSNTNGTAHSRPLTGLASGVSYSYYVRCQDNPAGNPNTSDYPISFSVATPPNMLPAVQFVVSPVSGTAPLTVFVDGSGSYDADGTITSYLWSWGNTSLPPTTGPVSTAQIYPAPGTYTITLQVTDNQNGISSAWQVITVSSASVIPPASTASICTAECTTDADCTGTAVCNAAGFCEAAGAGGSGPVRDDGTTSSLDGTIVSPFPFGTTSVNMTLTTDVNAACQYGKTANTAYGASGMSQFFTDGLTAHSVTLTGLGGVATQTYAYTYYVRCKDESGVVNTTDYSISFSIGGATLTSGPDPYLCSVNQSFIRNNIPYFFDVCTPACDPNNPAGPNADCANPTPRCDAVKKICVL